MSAKNALCALIAVFTVVAVTSADAKPKRIKQASVPQTSSCGMDRGVSLCPGMETAPMGRRPGTTAVRGWDVAYEGAVVGGRPAGCPYAFCGCATSLKVFGRIIPELNLAINWVRKFPRTHAAAGMVAARSGHVFLIQSVNGDGTVLAYDPNSGGHKIRLHTVSLRGYVTVNPYGGKYASNAAIQN